MSFSEIWRSLGVAALFSFPVVALFGDGPVFYVPAGLLCLYGAVAALRTRGVTATALFVATLLGSAMIGAMYFFAPHWSSGEKLRQFVLVFAVFGGATAYAISTNFVRARLGLALMLLGGLAAALLFFSPQEFQAGRLSFGENNPIWMARAVGWLGLGAAGWFLFNPRRFLPAGIFFLISVFGIILTASRGPLLALLLAASAGLLLSDLRYKWNVVVMGAATSVTALLALELMGYLDVGLLTLGSREDSSDIRANMIIYTIQMIAGHPGGIGVGWFNYQDALFYPHNIWLEVFVEWGWAFGASFVLLTAVSAWGVMRLPSSLTFAKMLLVYELVNAGLSGDVTSPRLLYGLLIIGGAQLIAELMTPRRVMAGRRDLEAASGQQSRVGFIG